MTSRLGRAGLSAISSTPVSGGYSPSQSSVTTSYDALSGLVGDKTYSSPSKSVKSSMYNNDDDDGYKKNLTKLFTCLLTDSSIGYSIEPSVDLWNSIDFNQSKLPKDNTSKTKRVSKYA